MAKCPSCGAEISPDAAFCTECGTKIAAAPTAPAPAKKEPERKPETPPAQKPPQTQGGYVPPQQTAPSVPADVVGVGAYFWLTVLYHIPFLGWLVCLVMCFAPRNRNLKNFSRATLIRMIIGLILFGLLCLGVKLFGDWVVKKVTGVEGGLSGLVGSVLGGDAGKEIGSLGELLENAEIQKFMQENNISENDIEGLLDSVRNR